MRQTWAKGEQRGETGLKEAEEEVEKRIGSEVEGGAKGAYDTWK